MHLKEIEGSKESKEQMFFRYLKNMCSDEKYPDSIKDLSLIINDIKRLNLKGQSLKIYLHEEINNHVIEIMGIYNRTREAILMGKSLREKCDLDDLKWEDKNGDFPEWERLNHCLEIQYIESTKQNAAKDNQEKFLELYQKIIEYYLFPKNRKWWSRF